MGRRNAGAALRARRLPAGTAARGTQRRLPEDGADRARPVLPPAVRAGYRSADIVLPVSDFNGRWAVRGGAAGGPGAHPAQRRRPAGAARCSRTSPTCRHSCSPAGSTPSRTSAPSSARSHWSASRFRTRGCGSSAGSRRATRPTRRRSAARRGPGSGGQRDVRGAGVAGVAGVCGRTRRRAVQPVRRAAADGDRGRDLGSPDRRDRRRRDARGGGPRRGGRAARRPGRVRGGVRGPADQARHPPRPGRRRPGGRAGPLHPHEVPRRRAGHLHRSPRRRSARPGAGGTDEPAPTCPRAAPSRTPRGRLALRIAR